MKNILFLFLLIPFISNCQNDGDIPNNVLDRSRIQLSEQARKSKNPLEVLMTDGNKKIKYWNSNDFKNTYNIGRIDSVSKNGNTIIFYDRNKSIVKTILLSGADTDTRLVLSAINDSLKVDILNVLTNSIISTSYIDNVINKPIFSDSTSLVNDSILIYYNQDNIEVGRDTISVGKSYYAENGLNLLGDKIRLGGLLLYDTKISGSDIHGLSFDSLSNFQVNNLTGRYTNRFIIDNSGSLVNLWEVSDTVTGNLGNLIIEPNTGVLLGISDIGKTSFLKLNPNQLKLYSDSIIVAQSPQYIIRNAQIDSTNGVLPTPSVYVRPGYQWTVVDTVTGRGQWLPGTIVKAVNGITIYNSDSLNLGGDLIKNTIINGKDIYSFAFDSITSFRVQDNTGRYNYFLKTSNSASLGNVWNVTDTTNNNSSQLLLSPNAEVRLVQNDASILDYGGFKSSNVLTTVHNQYGDLEIDGGRTYVGHDVVVEIKSGGEIKLNNAQVDSTINLGGLPNPNLVLQDNKSVWTLVDKNTGKGMWIPASGGNLLKQIGTGTPIIDSFSGDTAKINSLVAGTRMNIGWIVGSGDLVVNWLGASTTNSIQGNGYLGTPLQLVNDAASPGNSKYYGTDATGTKGFFNLPSGGSGTDVRWGNFRVVGDSICLDSISSSGTFLGSQCVDNVGNQNLSDKNWYEQDGFLTGDRLALGDSYNATWRDIDNILFDTLSSFNIRSKSLVGTSMDGIYSLYNMSIGGIVLNSYNPNGGNLVYGARRNYVQSQPSVAGIYSIPLSGGTTNNTNYVDCSERGISVKAPRLEIDGTLQFSDVPYGIDNHKIREGSILIGKNFGIGAETINNTQGRLVYAPYTLPIAAPPADGYNLVSSGDSLRWVSANADTTKEFSIQELQFGSDFPFAAQNGNMYFTVPPTMNGWYIKSWILGLGTAATGGTMTVSLIDDFITGSIPGSQYTIGTTYPATNTVFNHTLAPSYQLTTGDRIAMRFGLNSLTGTPRGASLTVVCSKNP